MERVRALESTVGIFRSRQGKYCYPCCYCCDCCYDSPVGLGEGFAFVGTSLSCPGGSLAQAGESRLSPNLDVSREEPAGPWVGQA